MKCHCMLFLTEDNDFAGQRNGKSTINGVDLLNALRMVHLTRFPSRNIEHLI
jgi:hypothetical protein